MKAEKNRALGKYGENLAARFLSCKGYRIIGRNVKTYVGEIDIVARDGETYVFVEVKTRKNKAFGPPYLSITKRKKLKLIHCSFCYLKMKNIYLSPWRIDIVSVEIDGIKKFLPKIEHFINAISE